MTPVTRQHAYVHRHPQTPPHRETGTRDARRALETTLRSSTPTAALSPAQFTVLCDVLLELVRVFGAEYRTSILTYLPFLLTVPSPALRAKVTALAVTAGGMSGFIVE